MRYWSLALVLVFLLPLASAELLFSQPSTTYNRGDYLNVTLTTREGLEKTSFLAVSLVCGSDSVDIYRSIISMSSGETRTLELSPKLEAPLLESFNGSCLLRASFGDETSDSPSFTLSNHIISENSFSTSIANPGETISIRGIAHKDNGEAVEGFVRVYWDEKDLSVSGIVQNGQFSLNLTLPPMSSPGKHNVRVEVYDKSASGASLNSGSKDEEIVLRAVLSRAELTLTSAEIAPGKNLDYAFNAYDQAGNVLSQDVRYDVYSPLGKIYLTRIAKTGVGESLALPANITPGYWRIEASVGDISIKKIFYLSEKELVSFEVVNETLIVTNLGNVPYKKSISVNIGNYSVVQDIDLLLDQTKRYKIKAPSDSYTVAITDGVTSVTAYNVPLTGRAVAIGEIGKPFFGLWWAGAFILVAFLGVFATRVYRSRKRQYFGESSESFVPRSSASIKGLPSAPASAYLAGTREQATILAFRTEPGIPQSKIDEAISFARNNGAAVSRDATHHLAIFSPRFTKKLENDKLAVQTAKEIASLLSIEGQQESKYGIAVGNGTIISDSQRPGAFSSVGSSIPMTKKLANASRGEVLISDELHAKLRTAIRAEKVPSINAWKLREVINRDQHNAFIDGFVKRNKKY